MEQGILLKRYGGFYYVKSDQILWECSVRGKFRKLKQDILPGDKVVFSKISDKKGVIEEILPRTNRLIRPPVANVDQVVVTFALKNPDPDFLLLDRILILAQYEKIKPTICFNKSDMVSRELAMQIMEVYQNAGYRTITTSTVTGEGIEELKNCLKGWVSVFAGPSGAGKTSLLNALQPGMTLKTGTVSEKIGRGRHTTKHVELLVFDFGGLITDTPGFSNLDLPPLVREEFQFYFPEISALRMSCRFNSCLHNLEPDCAVKEAVQSGMINLERYQRYQALLQQVIDNERRY